MALRATYLHTNLTVRDLDAMTAFYVDVFGCQPVRDPQELTGPWLDAITGVDEARMRYVHLRFPGHGVAGPELELIAYANEVEAPRPHAARLGFGHIAFSVDDVEAALEAVVAAGGSSIGQPVTVDIPGRGCLTEVYATDPEGNIIELQHDA